MYILECDQIVKDKLQFNKAVSHHDVTETVQNTLHGVSTYSIAYQKVAEGEQVEKQGASDEGHHVMPVIRFSNVDMIRDSTKFFLYNAENI